MYVNIFDMLVGFYYLTLGLFQSLMSYGGLIWAFANMKAQQHISPPLFPRK